MHISLGCVSRSLFFLDHKTQDLTPLPPVISFACFFDSNMQEMCNDDDLMASQNVLRQKPGCWRPTWTTRSEILLSQFAQMSKWAHQMSRANEHIKLLGLDSRRYDRGSFKSLTWIEPLLPLILLDLVHAAGRGKDNSGFRSWRNSNRKI